MVKISETDFTLEKLGGRALEKPIVKKIMGSAKDLFFRYGIRRISIEEICREAGVSKMTFYRHFKDKNDLAMCVLGKHFNERLDEYLGILKQDITFEDKLKRILDIKMKNVKSTSNELLKEILTDKDSTLGKWLTELNIRQVEKTREFIISAQDKGEIRSDIKVELVLFVIEKAWELLSSERILDAYEDKTLMFRELTTVLFYGILERKSTTVL